MISNGLKKILIVLKVLLIACLTSYGQKTSKNNTIIQNLDFAYLEGCETGRGKCDPITILRKTNQDSILLVFPRGGTESDVYLRSTIGNKIELHDYKTAKQGKPTLNLTKLEDGEYTANIVSCGLGGSCMIRIKTTIE